MLYELCKAIEKSYLMKVDKICINVHAIIPLHVRVGYLLTILTASYN